MAKVPREWADLLASPASVLSALDWLRAAGLSFALLVGLLKLLTCPEKGL